MTTQLKSVDLRQMSRHVFGTARGRVAYLGIASFVALLFGYGVCTVAIGPNEFGIKQVIVGANKGIRPDVYRAGLHWVTPGTERMHVFPTDLQVLALTNDPNERQIAGGRIAPALNIQTSEGYSVTVDVTLLYRIEDPYKVITTVGPGRLYESTLVVPRAEQLLRKRLGELDAEQFYDPSLRVEKARLALQDLNAELNPAGIKVMNVLVRRYVYDDKYQQAIEQRKIQDQTVFKNKAEGDLATATAEKDRIVAEGEAAVKVELATGDAEKQKLDSQAELYERTQRAQGEKLLKLAEAEGTKLTAAAYQGRGSEYQVGLKMADALKGTQVIVIPTDGESGINPLDLKSALKRFDVTP